MSEELSVEELCIDAEDRMNKTVNVLEQELSKIRTGRASAALVDTMRVSYFGTQTPINQLANVSVPDSSTILIQAWDPSATEGIQKAIVQSELGIMPSVEGTVIRLVIPPLTEQRRKELVRHAGKIAEEYKVSIRQIRKEANNLIKKAGKAENLPEDETKKALSEIQQLTDEGINRLTTLFEKKEKEILEI
ncbi:MAG: ribosome recycling factor [Candidatus Dadabacteria bacterium]|nr:ribosome recycling factor [Candidatus Dadabacteria bacterium]